MFSVSKKPTIEEIHLLYKDKDVSVEHIVQFFLNRSKQINKTIESIHYHTDDLALAQAAELDSIKKQYQDTHDKNWFPQLIEKYPLFGIPFAIKSNMMVQGEVMSAGSLVLDGFIAPYNSSVYSKVTQKGAVLIGSAHMDEFAMGASGETSAYATSKNPYDTTRVSGGSSSGSAASVASGQVVFSLGSDTGGSIRQPAAFTGVVGIKPTYGLVSRYGVISMTSSFDQVGPLTNSVADNIKVLQALAGKDNYDQNTLETDTSYLNSIQKPLIGRSETIAPAHTTYTLGIPKEFIEDGVDPLIKDRVLAISSQLTKLGHKVIEVSLPSTRYAVAVYYMIMAVEVAANLERFDGVRYRGSNTDFEGEIFYDYRKSFFGEEAQRRIMLGTYASSAGYWDAYYKKALEVKEKGRQEFQAAFETVDALITPTTPEFAFKIGQKTSDPLTMYLSDVFTCGINPVRIPGLVIPMGMFEVAQDDGSTVKLPNGIQVLGNEFKEDIIYRVGFDIESIVSML